MSVMMIHDSHCYHFSLVVAITVIRSISAKGQKIERQQNINTIVQVNQCLHADGKKSFVHTVHDTTMVTMANIQYHEDFLSVNVRSFLSVNVRSIPVILVQNFGVGTNTVFPET